MANHSFDKWYELMYGYAKLLIANQNILVFDENDVVAESPEADDIRRGFFEDIVKAHLHWLGMGAGVETLIKAVALKHEVLTITRNSEFDGRMPPVQTHFTNYEEVKAYRAARVLDKYQLVYQSVFSTKVSADGNPWLKRIFQTNHIEHPSQIKTNTLRKLVTQDIQKLVSLGKITQGEYDEIFNSMEVFRLTRRNIDMHTWLQTRIIGNNNNDIINIYIPMINLLTSIYHRD